MDKCSVLMGDIMEKIILNVIGIAIVAIGSVLSLWIIITTKTSFVGTCADLDSKPEQFKKEKPLVILGCILIISGSILQTISNFL